MRDRNDENRLCANPINQVKRKSREHITSRAVDVIGITIRRNRDRINGQLEFLQKTDSRNRAPFGVPIARFRGILLGVGEDCYSNDR